MPPPPPPPPGPPPPAAPAPPPVGKGQKAADRGALLNQIHKGAKLKKAITNDKSGPVLSTPKSTSLMGGGEVGGAKKFNMVAVRKTGGAHGLIPSYERGSVDDSAPAPLTPVGGGFGALFAGGLPMRPSQNKNQSNTGAARGLDAGPLRPPFIHKQTMNDSPGVPDGVINGPTRRNYGTPPPVPPSKITLSHAHSETHFRNVTNNLDNSNNSVSENINLISRQTSAYNIRSPSVPKLQQPPPPSQATPTEIPSSAAELNRPLSGRSSSVSGRPLLPPPSIKMQWKRNSAHIAPPPPSPGSKPALLSKPPPPSSGVIKSLHSPTDNHSQARFPPPSPPTNVPLLPPNTQHPTRQNSHESPNQPLNLSKPPPPPSSVIKPLHSPTDNHSQARFPPPSPPTNVPLPPPNTRHPTRQNSHESSNQPLNLSKPPPPPPSVIKPLHSLTDNHSQARFPPPSPPTNVPLPPPNTRHPTRQNSHESPNQPLNLSKPPPSSVIKPLHSPTDNHSQARFPPPSPPTNVPLPPPNTRHPTRQNSHESSNQPLNIPVVQHGPPPPPERVNTFEGPARSGPPPVRAHGMAPPPPERKSSRYSSSNVGYDDIEGKFRFHVVHEFPPPQPISKVNKVYPSKMVRNAPDRRAPPPPPHAGTH